MRQHFNQIILIDRLEQYVSNEDLRKWDGYLKDESHVCYYGRLLENAHGKDFEWLPFYKGVRHGSNDYARDDQHIYLYGRKVAGDAKTAHEIGYGYYLDAEHIYFRGKVLDGASPNAFELKGVFIVSNGHMYYRADLLPFDAATFQTLQHIDSNALVGCGGTTYAGSFIKDLHGIYALHATGELNRLEPIKTTDPDPQNIYAYEENVRTGSRWSGSLFYRDGRTLYFFSNPAKNSGSFESLLNGDIATLETYAALKRTIIFRDKTGFYTSGPHYHYGPK